jgi:hypothetical protein
MGYEIRLLIFNSKGWSNCCPYYGTEVDYLFLNELKVKIDKDLQAVDNKLDTGKSDLWFLSVKDEMGNLLAIRTPLGWQ